MERIKHLPTCCSTQGLCSNASHRSNNHYIDMPLTAPTHSVSCPGAHTPSYVRRAKGSHLLTAEVFMLSLAIQRYHSIVVCLHNHIMKVNSLFSIFGQILTSFFLIFRPSFSQFLYLTRFVMLTLMLRLMFHLLHLQVAHFLPMLQLPQ